VQNFNERVQEKSDTARRKIDVMKEEIKLRELEECSFAPKILNQKEKRSLDDFLKDQQKHVDKKQENIAKLQKDKEIREQSLLVSHPAISEYSKLLAETKKKDEGKPVFQRLFEKRIKPIVEEKALKEEVQKKPSPEKPNNRERRELTLYEDAKKRKEKLSARQNEKQNKTKPIKDFSRDPYIQQKYIKEFGNALASIEVLPEEFLSYERMSKTKHF